MWLSSSLFSAFIHTLIVVVVLFSVGTTQKIESKEKQPIEVELVNVLPPPKTETLLTEPLPPKTVIEPKKIEPNRPQPVKNEPVVPPVPAYDGEKIEIPSQPAVSAPSAATDSGGTSQSAGGNAAGTSSQRGGNPDRKAYPTYAPVPEYPVDARTGSVTGKVFIRVLIGTSGTVQEAQVSRSSGSASLDQAALRAIRNWEFAPAVRNGQPVADRIIVPVVFNMR